MAAVELTITGTLYDKLNRTTQQVVLIGEGSLTGMGVGGGPIYPPAQPPVGGGGGAPPHPAFPIWGGPGAGFPDKPGYPPTAEHPIVLPPNLPPETGDGRPIDWKTAWTPENGWMVVGIITPSVPHPAPSQDQ